MEFQQHGLSEFITIEWRDVCKDGFGLKSKVNAIFLDLPNPWEAIAFAQETFLVNRMGRNCCFGNCIQNKNKGQIDFMFIQIEMH